MNLFAPTIKHPLGSNTKHFISSFSVDLAVIYAVIVFWILWIVKRMKINKIGRQVEYVHIMLVTGQDIEADSH